MNKKKCNNYNLEEDYIRGDLIIELNVKLPIYKKIDLQNIELENKIKDLFHKSDKDEKLEQPK